MADLKSEKTRVSKVMGIEENQLFPQFSAKRNLIGFWTIGKKGKLVEFKLIGLNLNERFKFTLPEIFGKVILESELEFLGKLDEYKNLVSEIQAKKETIRQARQKQADEINRKFDTMVSKMVRETEESLGFNLKPDQIQKITLELEQKRESELSSLV